MSDREESFEELERRALFDLPEEEPAEETAPDLLGSLRGEEPDDEALDLTLGGYIERHNRVPAFEGPDGQPYTVDIDVEEEAGRFAAFLVFIRWAATGAGIMDHVESGDVAVAATEADARHAAQELTLYEIRAELDAAIARRRAALEE